MVTVGPGKDPGELTEAEQAALASLAQFREWDSAYSPAAGDPAADRRLRARRLTSCAGGVDRREVLVVEPTTTGTPRAHSPGSDCSTTSCTTGCLQPARRRPGCTGRASRARRDVRRVDVPSVRRSSPRRSFAHLGGGRSGASRTSAIGSEPSKGGHFAAFEQPANLRRRGTSGLPHDEVRALSLRRLAAPRSARAARRGPGGGSPRTSRLPR